jgi:ribosomal protein S18 acetylase RimI-like enzyme
VSEPLIRNLRWSDLDDVVNTYLSIYDEVNEDPSLGLTLYLSRPTIEDEVKWFSNRFIEIQSGKVVMKVAEVDSRVVGWCDIVPARANSEMSHVGILGILVKKEHRNRGIGQMLLASALRDGKSRFSKVQLGVFSGNAAAIHIYEKAGFKVIGYSPRQIKRGNNYFDEVIMEYYY